MYNSFLCVCVCACVCIYICTHTQHIHIHAHTCAFSMKIEQSCVCTCVTRHPCSLGHRTHTCFYSACLLFQALPQSILSNNDLQCGRISSRFPCMLVHIHDPVNIQRHAAFTNGGTRRIIGELCVCVCVCVCVYIY